MIADCPKCHAETPAESYRALPNTTGEATFRCMNGSCGHRFSVSLGRPSERVEIFTSNGQQDYRITTDC
ncbi:hypothetical protein PMO31116_02674 [Pandoraea morbifera]|uniref:Zinc finger Ogr/Delta-type domain-containing protein n=1 Tax=Pandoraea morbifera TaxID=2508300 RepID=A0A5E4VM18_9BURK|nr:hypothetical protein PMO31116_02674 [Pandoraea morbifera]